MGLKSSRAFLSVIFSIVLAFSTVLAITTTVLNSTMLKIDFYAKHAVTDEIVAECEKQLSAKYQALEAETGIPERVFNVSPVDSDLKSTMQRAISSVFREEDERLYSTERIERYYRLCSEYLEANDIEYNEDDVMRTAERAAKIYSDTVGIQNSDEIQKYLNAHSRVALKVNSVAFAGIVVSIVLIALMYRKLKKAYQFISAGLLGGGLATVIGSLLCIISGVGKGFDIEPLAYQSSFASMVKISFAIMLAVGLVVLVLTAVFVYYTQRDTDGKDDSNLKILMNSIIKK